ncbi:hypothetical protein [Acinetobacter sp. ANC 4641]
MNRNLSLCRKAQLPTADTTEAWLRQPKGLGGTVEKLRALDD